MIDLTREEREMLSGSGEQLLQQAGISGRAVFRRLKGGRNNRVYLVTGVQPVAVLKWYFRHPQDQRDRLHAEYAFLQFAESCGAECTARPLACDDATRLALYSYVPGHALTPQEVDEQGVEQAVDFLQLLNEHRETAEATPLPHAAEACFSLQEHLDCVTGRVTRLQSLPVTSTVHESAARFVEGRLRPELQRAAESLVRWADQAGVRLTAVLPNSQRCISPSDFGFHNAVRRAGDKLAFFDFEYAGWDDPAKALCDFYCQPELPAPRATWPVFAAATATMAGDTPLERQRQAALLPLYQIKWCCILLNEFLPAAGARREFADPQSTDLNGQLAKAERLIDELK